MLPIHFTTNLKVMKVVIFKIILLICASSLANTQGAYYNAAVVDFHSLGDSKLNSTDRLTLNVKEYINIIDNIVANQSETLDIIVFPEAVLVSQDDAAFVPPPNEILCKSSKIEYANFLKDLSCAAVHYGTHIVINIVEKEKCTNETNQKCNDLGLVLYNTNVVLHPDGTVPAKYRKWNLFIEPGISKPLKPETPTFKIGNVTFGMFTCFDILFSEPVLKYTREMNIKNFAFPTMWFSQLPFLTTLQVQQMWSQENDVVLLAAESNRPEIGSSGSGIYYGSKGPLQTLITAQDKTSVLVHKIPTEQSKEKYIRPLDQTNEEIDSKAKLMDKLYLKVDGSIVDHNSIVLNSSVSKIDKEVCHGTFPRICCYFNISIYVSERKDYSLNEYTYHLAAFNGIRVYGGLGNTAAEDCAILACLNNSLSSCGQRFSNYSQISWPITFEAIQITANFTNDATRIQFPNSLLTSITPIPPQFTSWQKEEKEGQVIRSYSITKPQSRLLTFAIYGRDFYRNGYY